MPKLIIESEIEQVALDILSELKYKVIYGPDIAPFDSSADGGVAQGKPDGFSRRQSYADVILVDRLREAIDRFNPDIPAEAKEEAIKRILRTESPDLVINNHRFHKMLVDGVDVEYRKDERIVGDKIWLFDFDKITENEFLAVNQWTVIENNINRRPDIVLFINGLPIAVIELKNPADENATTFTAFKQFQTYKIQIPSLFKFNEILIASDGFDARAGTITSDWERFLPWKTIDGNKVGNGLKPFPTNPTPQIDVLLRGMFNKKVLLDLVRNFVVFEQERDTRENAIRLSKKVAAYHQYHAVNKAIGATLKASSARGDKRCGVVWHTQGSGKSLIMAFYTGKLVLALDNPTIVLLTDRNDLDDQLFGTFSRCSELLRQAPVQAESRAKLREYLKVSSGGIVFITIQKFLPEEKGDIYPLLSERRNIVVIADEAHRSQYDFIDGFARHMRDALPNASFIGFTGTPIEKQDRNTIAVFGDYIDIYDIEQAVNDGATVRIYYESHLAQLELKPEERPKIDPEFEEATLGVNDSAVKVLGDETLKMIARELVQAVRNNVTIDWTLKESVQAKLRVMVKRVLRKHGYPPDKEKKATETVLEQATLLCKDWAEKPISEEKSDLFFSDVISEGSYKDGYLPIYDLQAVATAFREQPTPNIKGWKPMPDKRNLNEDMFIARVVGKSMEPTIPDGSWCLFRFERGGSRNGLIVLVESRLVSDPETHQSFTIKRYRSEKENMGGSQWMHKKIILSPDNKDFKDIVIENVSGDDFRVVAEFIEVLR